MRPGPNYLTRLPGSPKNHFCPFSVLQILPWVSVQLSLLKLSLLETRGFRTLSTKLKKIKPALTATLLSHMTPRDWNSLPATVFPATYNLHPHPQTPSTPTQPINLLLFFSSRSRGQPRPLGDAPFWCISFSHQYHKKKKKTKTGSARPRPRLAKSRLVLGFGQHYLLFYLSLDCDTTYLKWHF